MYKYSKRSIAKIEKEAAPDMKLLLYTALPLSYLDFGIGTIYRNKKAQNAAYDSGASKVRFPDGEHNTMPSNAADLFAYKKKKPTYEMIYYVALLGVMYAAFTLLQMQGKISQDKYLRSGIDWDMDRELLTDQEFDDGMHFEIRKKKVKTSQEKSKLYL